MLFSGAVLFLCYACVHSFTTVNCPANEVYRDCGNNCTDACNSELTMCTMNCYTGCFCNVGYGRLNGGACVKRGTPQCSPSYGPGSPGFQKPPTVNSNPQTQCPQNEVYRDCGNNCTDACNSELTMCTMNCYTGCFCNVGYGRLNGGACVKRGTQQCSPSYGPGTPGFQQSVGNECPANEIYKDCGNKCNDACKTGITFCPANCERGCFCIEGYGRLDGGGCVKRGTALCNEELKFPPPTTEAAFQKAQIDTDLGIAPPTTLLAVIFPQENIVMPGNEMTPTEVRDIPMVKWPANSTDFHSVVFLEIDLPSRADPSGRSALHWLVANVPGGELGRGKTLAQYIGSGPGEGTGLHRYVFLVFRQPSAELKMTNTFNIIVNTTAVGRDNFDIAKLVAEENLGTSVAGNFYEAKYDDYVPILSKQMGF